MYSHASHVERRNVEHAALIAIDRHDPRIEHYIEKIAIFIETNSNSSNISTEYRSTNSLYNLLKAYIGSNGIINQPLTRPHSSVDDACSTCEQKTTESYKAQFDIEGIVYFA
jgi:hypothetical protein